MVSRLRPRFGQIETQRAAGPELRARFSPDQTAVLEALNRADAANLPRLDTLVIPDVWSTDLRMYSPFPLEYAWGVTHETLLRA